MEQARLRVAREVGDGCEAAPQLASILQSARLEAVIAVRPQRNDRPEPDGTLSPVKWRTSLVARVAVLIFAGLALQLGSSWWMLLEQRELHANLERLTRIYVPFQENLGHAHASETQLRNYRSAPGMREAATQSRERDLVLRAALENRSRLVAEARKPLAGAREFLLDALGARHEGIVLGLLNDVETLEALVEEDEAASISEMQDASSSEHESVSRWNRIDQLFRRLRERSAEMLQAQEDEITRARERTERSTWVASLLVLAVALLAASRALWMLRPLRRLTQRAQELARGDFSRPLEISDDPQLDNEVSRLAREFNRMAEALRTREQQVILAEKLAAVGQLSAQIAHEIRNPLSAMALNLELLGDELADADEGARTRLSRIESEVDRLTQITETYLSLARPRVQGSQVFDLSKELADLLDFLAREHESVGIQVQAQGLSAPVWTRGEPRQLRQALMNILRNAKEAVLEDSSSDTDGLTAAAAPSIGVRLTADLSGHQIRISDNGHGIHLPPAERERIFEPFMSSKPRGTGLGLPIVERIVADHGGKVEVESTGPQGTTILLRLVACAPPDASVSSDPSGPPLDCG